jgi:hypothetical protein
MDERSLPPTSTGEKRELVATLLSTVINRPIRDA